MEHALNLCSNCMGYPKPSLFNPTPVPRDIIDTNNPPSDAQIPSIRDFVSGAHARMIQLNAAIDKLIQEREALDVEIRKYQGALSPIRRIPTEILSHIFTFALPPHLPERASESAPWIISAVSARWRAIVLSQPHFWSSIDIRPLKIPPSDFKLETQLRRSRELPLNIFFACTSLGLCTARETELISILAQHCARWETVTLYGPKALCSALQHRPQRQFSLLRKLCVEMFFEDESASLDVFDDAPKLEEVSFNSRLWDSPVALRVPWSRLLKYGGCNTWEGHLHTLQSTSNLVECSLEFWSNTTPVGTLIQLPRLLRLYLSEPAFLACLDTPALLELHCDGDSVLLSAFFHRVPCKLQKLVLRDLNNDIDASVLSVILNAAPSTTYLGLPSTLPVGFLAHLSSIPELAPALECMSFNIDDLSCDPGSELVYAVESPVWQARKLRSLKLGLASTSSDNLLEVDRMRSRGMEITVFSTECGRRADMTPEALPLRPRY
ncbi:hypothetical protein FB451DRAFT_1291523 [Mycena latifolia]|nr:hypothetical protein FB451DRAFT_1326537 [Mycena latifolia]KAJ7446804.1 hypothetical protein FB451DRAFT_1291523 [Mycena latifolia]